jgi:aminoglycoside phosphotransferase (APT) family kinase protein
MAENQPGTDVAGARPVRDEDAFDVAAMAAWLAENATLGSTEAELSGVPEVRQFSGGVSNLTYLLRYPGGDLILRRPPEGTHRKGAHDMGRQHLPAHDALLGLTNAPRWTGVHPFSTHEIAKVEDR